MFYHIHDQMIQFQCVDCSEIEEYKEELIKVEDISINFSYSSGDGDVVRVPF